MFWGSQNDIMWPFIDPGWHECLAIFLPHFIHSDLLTLIYVCRGACWTDNGDCFAFIESNNGICAISLFKLPRKLSAVIHLLQCWRLVNSTEDMYGFVTYDLSYCENYTHQNYVLCSCHKIKQYDITCLCMHVYWHIFYFPTYPRSNSCEHVL